MNSTFKKNIFFALLAQSTSLFVSVLSTLLIPRLLGIESFSLWQLYIFYTTYVGFFHFGINDGLYLRLGGIEYSDIDFFLAGSQFKILSFLQILVSIIIVVFSFIFVTEYYRIFVIIMTSVFMIISNLWLFLSFILQAVNKTKLFSISVMIDRILFGIGIVSLILFGVENFQWLVFSSLLGRFAALMFNVYHCKEIVFAKFYDIEKSISEVIINLKVGSVLMLANIANMIILGIGKMIIDLHWGLISFGLVSFAIAIINFFLMFIGQISMVLFPALRKLNSDELKKKYIKIRIALGIALPLIFLFYFPMKILLNLWLPELSMSYFYLGILLPICFFDAKMKLLFTTYFKVLRKEKILFLINTSVAIFSLILSLVSAFIFNNLYLLIFCMVISVGIKCIIAEIYISKLMQNKNTKIFFQEMILISIFILATTMLPPIYAILLYSISYVVFLAINYDSLRSFFKK